MDIETTDEQIKDTIQKSLETPPQKLDTDFYDVAWNLPRWHLLMLKDRERLEYYSNVIRPKVAGKVVLDVGTGSGILSYLALKWGAKKVYSVEQNPALQGVYKHLMREHLESGKAELICDDAKFLRLDQFRDGAPEVVVHELFGSIGMGENLIPIFRALAEEGILTPKTDIVPDCLEVWTRPAFSDLIAEEGHIEEFEGYQLNQLNLFESQNFWEQDYISAKSSDWKKTGEAQLVFRCNLYDFILPEKVELSFKASHSSHLQLWMKIIDTKSGLIHSNDHQDGNSHWANAYLAIPFWMKGKDFKVELRVNPDRIQVIRFY